VIVVKLAFIYHRISASHVELVVCLVRIHLVVAIVIQAFIRLMVSAYLALLLVDNAVQQQFVLSVCKVITLLLNT
jgi:hypothetical protein